MATIIERGEGQFRAIIKMKNRGTGVLHKESRTFKTNTLAQEWATGIETDLRRAVHNDTHLIDSTTLAELIDRYITEVSPKKLGAKQEIVRLKAWKKNPLSRRSISRCLPKDFADYITRRRKDISKRGGPIAEQTIKHEIIAISNVFEVARKDWGYNIQNPTKQISKPGGSNIREVRILPEAWEKLAVELLKCKNEQYVIISEFAIETGLRAGELMRMNWIDINLAAKKIVVLGKDTSSRTGTRKKRTVPLSIRALELLTTLSQPEDLNTAVFYVPGKTSADSLSRAFTAACKRAGIKNGEFHATRHEAASRMAPHFPMLILMAIFGWTTPSMAARYYHASDDDLHAGLARMYAATVDNHRQLD